MRIDIKPVTKTLDILDIISTTVMLDNSAVISVVVTNNRISEAYSLTMDAATYAGWGSDDEYVVNWVLSELGLERA